MNSFIMSVSSTSFLLPVLNKLRNSIWWNHEGIFFFSSNLSNECAMVRVLFDLIWRFNILQAIFLCKDKYDKINIYTFNPFDNFAPAFWNNVKESKAQEKTLFQHSWTASSARKYSKKSF